jgi:two-component system response regulator (stage 0 sporulation protein A)
MEIIALLKRIRFPFHVRGYHYTKTAMEIILNDSGVLEAVTKELYPAIAQVHNTTSHAVERALRHGIELTYSRNTPKELNQALGLYDPNNNRPTISEFLAVVTEEVRMTLEGQAEKANQAELDRLEQLRKDLITLGVLVPIGPGEESPHD